MYFAMKMISVQISKELNPITQKLRKINNFFFKEGEFYKYTYIYLYYILSGNIRGRRSAT